MGEGVIFLIPDLVSASSTLLAAVIGALFTLLVHRGGKRSEAAREQLDKVYAPSFVLIEESLYKNISAEECDLLVNNLEGVAHGGGVLTDPRLIDLITRYKLHGKDENFDYKHFKYRFFKYEPSYLSYWFDICSHIDKTNDVLRKRSFLPIRSVRYRLRRGQYINGVVWVLNFFKVEWPSMVFFACLLLLTWIGVLGKL